MTIKELYDKHQHDFDIFKGMAAELYAIPIEEVTEEQRRVMKSASYSFLYGSQR